MQCQLKYPFIPPPQTREDLSFCSSSVLLLREISLVLRWDRTDISGSRMCTKPASPSARRAVLDIILIVPPSISMSWLLLAAAILSWLIAFMSFNGATISVRRVAEFLYMITEPVLAPIRRYAAAPRAVLEFSPIILILIIMVNPRVITYTAIRRILIAGMGRLALLRPMCPALRCGVPPRCGRDEIDWLERWPIAAPW